MVTTAPLEARLNVSANWRIADSYIQHATRLRRYRNAVDKETRMIFGRYVQRPLLNEAERRLHGLASRTGDQMRYRYRNDSSFRALLATGKLRIRKGMDRIFNKLTKELLTFAKEEARFSINIMGREIPIKLKLPSETAFKRLVEKETFSGATLKKHMQSGKVAMFDDFSRALNTGLSNGESPTKIMRRLRGTRNATGVAGRMNNRLSTITRTAVHHSAGGAQGIAHRQNEKVIRYEVWTAVLDSGVCFACASEDGQRYKTTEGPQPPLHPHCRCVRLPVLKSAKEMGLKASAFEPAQRRALDGSIPRISNFDKWFKGQPAAYKKDYLGPGRYQLWKSGKITDVKQFVNQEYRTLRLDELFSNN